MCQTLRRAITSYAVSAEGYSTNTLKVTVASGADKTADVTLAGVLSLQDLGISSDQAQGTAQDQARLNKRSHMLMLHQRLGLIAAVPLIATVATSFGAGGQKHQHGRPLVAFGSGLSGGGFVFHERLLRDSRAQNSGDAKARADSSPQGSRVDSRAGHDPDADSRRHRLRSKKQR